MPVILEDAAAIQEWLSPERTSWSSELQSLLKPYGKELEIYPVPKEVGKVGNDSASFVVPLDSKENKNNIKNFFGGAKKKVETKVKEEGAEEEEAKVKKEGTEEEEAKVKKEEEHVENKVAENNAPLPLPKVEEGESSTAGVKRTAAELPQSPRKQVKIESSSPAKHSPSKSSSSKKSATRSATSNTPKKKKPAKADGNKKITSFFGK
jgi:hypothetical protein